MQLAFPDATAAMHQDVRRAMLACMETGNIDRARTVLTEYEDQWPKEAKELRTDIVAAYGTSL